jgi:hypothetical protein
MAKLTGLQLERIVEVIRSSFTLDELRQILLFKVDRDLSDIVLPNNKIIAVVDLVATAVRQGWMIPLLRSLKAARSGPEKKDFRRVIDEALIILENPEVPLDQFGIITEISLPPCDWCWWRELSIQGIEALSHGLQQNRDKFVKGSGIPRLTEALHHRLGNDTNPNLCREIVDAANILLSAAFGKQSNRMLIVASFDGKEISDDWAKALSTANGRGRSSLVALFLSVFLLHGRLKSLADANLQRLHKEEATE